MQSNEDFCKHLSSRQKSSRPILMAIISLYFSFSSRQQFRTLSCQVQLVFFSLIVIRVASLSVIETSFCQFRKFSERGRMLTHVFLDHKTCTQQLVLGKIFLQFWRRDYFYYLYLVIKELWKQQAFFL